MCDIEPTTLTVMSLRRASSATSAPIRSAFFETYSRNGHGDLKESNTGQSGESEQVVTDVGQPHAKAVPIPSPIRQSTTPIRRRFDAGIISPPVGEFDAIVFLGTARGNSPDRMS